MIKFPAHLIHSCASLVWGGVLVEAQGILAISGPSVLGSGGGVIDNAADLVILGMANADLNNPLSK